MNFPFSKVWALNVLLLFHFASPNTLAQPVSAKTAIHRIVRQAAASEAGVAKIELSGQDKTESVTNWISKNRFSIEGARRGPFDATPEFVAFYKDNRIFVHVLNWADKNNLSLPAVIDRPVLKASLLNGPPVRVDQAPWGLLIVVPEEQRPDDIDTIVVLEFAGTAAELGRPESLTAHPLASFCYRLTTPN